MLQKVGNNVGLETEYKFLVSKEKFERIMDRIRMKYPELEINGGRDPHIWMSPKRAMIMLSAISDEIIKNYKGKEEFYRKNYEDYNNKLKLLDNKIHSLLDTKQNRKAVLCYGSKLHCRLCKRTNGKH